MNPELKFLRLDYWGGHLLYNDAPFPDGVMSIHLLMNITDVEYVSLGGAFPYNGQDSIRLWFRNGDVTAQAQYVELALASSQSGTEVVQWMQEQIRNAFESDSAIYYPPTAPPILFDTYGLGSINN